MVSPLRKRKLTRLFRLYDVDRNGLVEQADFELIAHKTALAMNHQPDSPAYNTLHNQYMTGWARLAQLGDANDDQRLSLDEYCAAYDKMLAQPAQFTAMMMGIVSTIIMLLDTDKDGKVSVPEYTAYLMAWGTAAGEIAETFHQLDRDSDGYLIADELRQNAEEFFFSEDPAARGNWLVGPF